MHTMLLPGKDGALQVVGYQISPQLFKFWLYISTIFMRVSGTCDVVQSCTVAMFL